MALTGLGGHDKHGISFPCLFLDSPEEPLALSASPHKESGLVFLCVTARDSERQAGV